MRLAVLAACPFPNPQGSQLYLVDQLRALAKTGMHATLFTYGRGRGPAPPEIEAIRIPALLSPRALAAGPQWSKPVADIALVARFLTARRAFDAILAHHAEAAAIALSMRPVTRLPVVYVAHALLGCELASYAHPAWRGLLDRAGSSIDRFIARRATAVIALCRPSARALGAWARGPVALIPPGLDPQTPPTERFQRDICARFGLAPRRFVLYAGNLDPYQGLDLLELAARELRAEGTPVVAITHDAGRAGPPGDGLEIVEVASFDEVRALSFAAGALVHPRRTPGGFPIKLLNYMETARPIVAFGELDSGLEHERSAWLLAPGSGSVELAMALRRLLASPELGDRIGRGARRHLLRNHAWDDIARRTVELLGKVRSS